MKLKKILDYLKCPHCNNQKLLLKAKKELICGKCKKTFKVINGVPILIDKEHLGAQEKNQIEWFEDHYSKFSKEEYCLENWRLSMVERIFSAVKKGTVKTYLDIGCGATGYTAIEGAKRNKWLSFGIDISTEAMLRAKNLAKKQEVEDKTAFVVCSAENLPFKPEVFDYVSAVSLLEHLEKDTEAIKSISQIIRKKGWLYVCVPNTYKKMWPFLWPVYRYIDYKIGHKRHYSIEDLGKKTRAAGFRKINVFYNAHLIKLGQIILEKMRLIDDKNWWKLERKDINTGQTGIQLNAIFEKR
ncbi:methyltransferase domain-containing protein [Patescibacteria group bacterium]|nr:methyltransferase domain-containing protein [Patescibacteria group bacterium]